MKAKTLITGEGEPLNEAPENMEPPRGPGGPPRRPGGPPMRSRGSGGQSGPPGEPGEPSPGQFGGKEKPLIIELVILDLLQALNHDRFFTAIADIGLKGAPITPELARHFLDEAPKYADKMSPGLNALMEKIAGLAR